METHVFDVVVIGGGPGGEACAARIGDTGARVALVERERIGGECPYWGCMPSKALLQPGSVLAEVQRVPGAAQSAKTEVDIAATLARRDEVVRHLDDTAHATRVEKHGVAILRGHGRLAGERRVEVTMHDGSVQVLEASNAVVLAPGTYASLPPIEGLRESQPWTNRHATNVTAIPERFGVLGGGVIGVEMAQAYTTLGSTVTLFESGPRLLPREEPEATDIVHAALRDEGVDVVLDAHIRSVERRTDGTVCIHMADGSTHEVDELLVATGRHGAVDDLGLHTVGVTPTARGTIDVTDCMCVPDLDWLYVVGDANGRAQLTHAAIYQAKIAARNALGVETHCVEDHVTAPRVIFTEPNVFAVGHTLADALAAGVRARAFDRDPQRTAAGSFVGRGTAGFARLVVDLDTGCIVGATFVGTDLAELLHSATIAIVGGVTLDRLRHCVAPFPTRSDVWNRFVDLMEADTELASNAALRAAAPASNVHA